MIPHFKQFGLGVHNYHDTHLTLPTAGAPLWWQEASGPAISGQYSLQFHLLPFIEQGARHSNVVGSATRVGMNDVNVNFQGVIPCYACPSDPNSTKPGLGNGQARTNIMTCRGDYALHNAHVALNATAFYAQTPFNIGRAPFMQILNADSTQVQNRVAPWRGFEGITDGTSNTMAASESAVAESDTTTLIRGGVIFGGTINNNNTSATAPNVCYNLMQNGTEYVVNGINNMATPVRRGSLFTDVRISRSGFCAVLPPNSPSCLNGLASGTPENNMGYYSATSYHPGGVNILRFDGSVTFITDNINAGNASNQQAYDGCPSPYGVWGALGTIAQGD